MTARLIEMGIHSINISDAQIASLTIIVCLFGWRVLEGVLGEVSQCKILFENIKIYCFDLHTLAQT